MRFHTRTRRTPQVIIVSLIDIFAILLIFVIVTTTFKKEARPQPAVTIKLPESKTAVAAEQTAEPVVLTVSEKEELFLDDKPVPIDALKATLEETMRSRPKQTLALNIDTKAPFGVVVKVLDVLKESGVKGDLAAFMEQTK